MKNKIISLENNINILNSDIKVNNVSINCFGNEKSVIESFTNNEMSTVGKYGGDAITKAVQFKHYNTNIPENHNLLLNAQRDEMMLVFDGNNFKETGTNEMIDNLIAKSYTDIYNILRLTENELNPNQKRNIPQGKLACPRDKLI